MTALTQYDRIEASALWRESAQDQRREVILSLGDATLIITDRQERPLAHWSLAAVRRQNPGAMPAIFSPDGDSDEIIELDASEQFMIDAIDKICAVIERRRPKPGRLRTVSFVGVLSAVFLILLLWMPFAVRDYTLRVLPAVTRAEIGVQIAKLMTPYTGAQCFSPIANPAQMALQSRILDPNETIRVMPQGVQNVAALPGGIFLIDRRLVEDFEDPDVVAGFLLAEKTRVSTIDPMQDVLSSAGILATFRLLTTGEIDDDALADYAREGLSQTPDAPEADAVIDAFLQRNISLLPYAEALDITGETTLPLIEADALRTDMPRPSLSDIAWVSLQGICGG